MINPDDLNRFTGTEQWHRFNSMMRDCLLTDGAKYVADEAGAYWLMDIIGSAQLQRGRWSATWKGTRNGLRNRPK